MDIQAIRVEIEDLCRAGARFVLCNANKRAIQGNWLGREKPSADAVIAHLMGREGALVGIVPGSLGLMVFDLDRGDLKEALIAFVGFPKTYVRSSQEGRYHLWAYKPDGEVGNANWHYGDCGGEVRGDNGYVILWHEQSFVEVATMVYEAPEPRKPVPKALIAKLTAKRTERSATKTKGFNPKAGERNNELNKALFKAFANNELPKAEALAVQLMAAAIKAGLSEAEVQNTLKSAKPAGIKARGEARRAVEGKPILDKLNMAGLERVFREMDIQVRYNIRDRRIDYNGRHGWQPLNDRVAARMAFEIEARYMVKGTKPGTLKPALWSKLNFERCIDGIVAVSSVDPFIEWLEALPEWDGAERLEWLLQGLFDAENNALTRWASIYCMTAAIQRAYEPGCSIDHIPVLIGDKGMGKSTFVEHLLPSYEWYGSELDMGNYDTRRRVECLLGKVIVEWAELDGIRKAQWSSVKAFLTRRNDGQVRLAYARQPEDMPRRVIFIGTANDEDALPNDGNIRRLVPIKLNRAGKPWEYLPRIRDYLWAEALHLYRQGYQARLPEELHDTAMDVANQYRYRDTIEERLEGMLDDCIDKTTDEVAELLDLMGDDGDLSPRIQRRIAKGLNNLGMRKVRRQVMGNRKYIWVHK